MHGVEFWELRGPRWDLGLCRVVEAMHGEGLRVYLWAESESEARRFDDLLWTYRDDSFVPHRLWEGESRCEDPVAVGWLPGNPNRATCLVLARSAAPDEIRGFARVIDFAPVDLPALRQAARERFRAFQAAGHRVTFRPAEPGS